MRRPPKLTAKEEAFAQAVVSGKTLSDAYRYVYSTKANPAVVSVAANRVINRPRIAQRIAQLRDRAARPAVLSRARKLERLAAMLEEQMIPKTAQLTADQIRALEVDNRMQGHNEAEKLKVEGMGSLLQKIRKDAQKP